jgi:hypothetical protein
LSLDNLESVVDHLPDQKQTDQKQAGLLVEERCLEGLGGLLAARATQLKAGLARLEMELVQG